ncbi:MAG: SIS domain-containing protein [Anaerolineae bacterium]|nr:SIS domain-containing protein [Anaerolineae bacterium]
MASIGEFSLREITTQQQSWQSAITAAWAERQKLCSLFQQNKNNRIFFIGCGSTHYLAKYAAPFFQSVTGMICQGVPSSELYFQTDTLVLPQEKPLVIALSRSGATSETIMAVEKLKEQGSRVLTVTCYGDSPLARISDLTIEVAAGREESYAQTRSFAGMLVAVQAIAAIVAEDEDLLDDIRKLPSLGEEIIAKADALAKELGQNESFKRITYLGSGELYGLAGEAMIKMKEMSLSIAEAFHFMEFRHGPMALVDSEHLIVALLSERMRDYEEGVLRDLKTRGAYVAIVANDAQGLGGFDRIFSLGADVRERARAVLYLPFVQLLAYHRAMGRGLNPDRPRNVVMAIRLDGTEMKKGQ